MYPLRISAFAFPLVAAFQSPSDVRHEAETAVEKRGILSELAQFNFKPFQLTDLHIDCNRPNATTPLYSCRLQFDWFDPNSVAENNVTSTTCNSTWTWDGVSRGKSAKNTFDTNYALCSEAAATFFEMRFVHFESAANFTLELAHRYKDDQTFPPPYDYPLTFAEPNLDLPLVHRDSRSMQFCDPGPVNATVVGLTD